MVRRKKAISVCSFILAVAMLTACSNQDEIPDNNLGVDTMPIVTDDWSEGNNTVTESTSENVVSITEPADSVAVETTTTEPRPVETTTVTTTEQVTSEVTKPTEATTLTQATTRVQEQTQGTTAPVITLSPITTTEQVQVTTVAPIVVKPSGFTGELLDLSTTLNVILSEGKAYWYEQLTEREENAYNKMLSAVLKYRSTVTFDTSLTLEEYNRVFALVYNQNPELFWLSGKTSLSEDGKTGTLFYIYNEDTAKAMQVKLDKRVKELLDMMNADMTDLEKVLLCHNYIVKYNSYSNEAKNSANAYGCLIEGKSQCSGYAKGLQYMCDQLKIPCMYVNGISAETTGTHAWNKVMLDGEWYNIDVMWDDPDMEPEDKKNVSYRYMCVPDSTINGLTHLDANMSADKTYTFFNLPACTSTKLNADVQYGMYATTYEEVYEKLKKSVFEAVENGRYCAHVKVSTQELYKDSLDRLMTQKEVYNIRDAVNAEYGAGYIVGFAGAPENAMNYIEVTIKYGEGCEPR